MWNKGYILDFKKKKEKKTFIRVGQSFMVEFIFSNVPKVRC